jgi:uncharacterized protein (DUF305 family)
MALPKGRPARVSRSVRWVVGAAWLASAVAGCSGDGSPKHDAAPAATGSTAPASGGYNAHASDVNFVARAAFHFPATADLAQAATDRDVRADVQTFAARVAETREALATKARELAIEHVLDAAGRHWEAQPALLGLKADLAHVSRDARDEDVGRVFLQSLVTQDRQLLSMASDVMSVGEHDDTVAFAGVVVRHLEAESFEASRLLAEISLAD